VLLTHMLTRRIRRQTHRHGRLCELVSEMSLFLSCAGMHGRWRYVSKENDQQYLNPYVVCMLLEKLMEKDSKGQYFFSASESSAIDLGSCRVFLFGIGGTEVELFSRLVSRIVHLASISR
jgi:hypothetical protein